MDTVQGVRLALVLRGVGRTEPEPVMCQNCLLLLFTYFVHVTHPRMHSCGFYGGRRS